jgi:hypothetical protein
VRLALCKAALERLALAILVRHTPLRLASWPTMSKVKFGASVRNWLSMNDPGGVSENHNPSPMSYYDNGIG